MVGHISMQHRIFLQLSGVFSLIQVYSPVDYSAVQNSFCISCFMKQKCQLQMGMAQYRNAAKPLRTRCIMAHQHFQMRYVTLF